VNKDPNVHTQKALISIEALPDLIAQLATQGYTVIGPQRRDDAIVLDEISSTDQLPVGWDDEQQGGTYRLVKNERDALFDYVVGPHSWKRYLHPPVQRLWQAERRGKSFTIKTEPEEAPRYAFFGVRSCDIHAIETQDRVFDNGDFADPSYLSRRAKAFIVAVNCARPAATCFCTSLNTGPKAQHGFDLAFTELIDTKRHVFVVEIGTQQGAKLLAQIPHRETTPEDLAAAEAVIHQASQAIQRELVPQVDTLLKNNLEHPRWNEVAQRCLSCTNCTMVCPTCFCTTVEDTTDLSGQTAERWRTWDSCFSLDFSYIHGGSIRREGRSRYRQWMTHKLATWHDQFGSSGCVGCGRCITWCPVGIDITEEARAIRDNAGGT
jgi:ferredoxin